MSETITANPPQAYFVLVWYFPSITCSIVPLAGLGLPLVLGFSSGVIPVHAGGILLLDFLEHLDDVLRSMVASLPFFRVPAAGSGWEWG